MANQLEWLIEDMFISRLQIPNVIFVNAYGLLIYIKVLMAGD